MSAALAELGDLLRGLKGFNPESFDAQALIDQMTDAQVEGLLGPIAKENEYIRTHKYDLLFPDEGPFRRELYLRHIEFFKAGAEYRERCFMAANRCITPWTYLETAGKPVLAAKAWISKDQKIRAWAGGSKRDAQTRGGFVMGIEPAFRLVMDTGEFFDCSRKHRVLTTEGYASLDQIMSRSSGLRCWHKLSDYQANCDVDGYLGDQPLRSIAGISLQQPPPSGDAQKRGPFHFSLPDEAERKLQYIRSCPQSDRLSTPDDLRRFADLFSLFAGPSCDMPVLQPSARSRVLQQLATALAVRLRSNSGLYLGQTPASFLVDLPDECRVDQGRHLPQVEASLTIPLCLDAIYPHPSVLSSLTEKGRIATFYPSYHPLLIGGGRILAVVPLGYQPIIDIQVPGPRNYIAGGVVHSNCGKTVAGAYETTAHLTGQYKKWWPGRRFTTAIDAWAAGDTNETTRDIIQKELFGEITWGSDAKKCFDGSGMVPRAQIGRITWKSGVQDLADTVEVRHVTGRWSRLGLKSYDQGRRVFQGTAKGWIWLDEECPLDVYGECLYRTATTGGMVALTFTPLLGISETVLSFLPAEMRPDA